MIYYHQEDKENGEIDLMQDKMYVKFGDLNTYCGTI